MKREQYWIAILVLTNVLTLTLLFILKGPSGNEPPNVECLPMVYLHSSTDTVRMGQSYSISAIAAYNINQVQTLNVDLYGGSRFIRNGDWDPGISKPQRNQFIAWWIPSDSLFRDTVHSLWHLVRVEYPQEGGAILEVWDSIMVPVAAKK